MSNTEALDEVEETIKRKDAIYVRFAAYGLPIDGDKTEMLALLTNGTLLRAINMIKSESSAKADMLRTHDLSKQDSINAALKIQGEANGLLRAIDILIDIAFTDNFN